MPKDVDICYLADFVYIYNYLCYNMRMENQFCRTELLIGSSALQKLNNAHVAVFGAGGVGGYAIEALIRSGVGTLTIVDGDSICLSNLNRQIHALHSTLGQNKAQAAKARALDINPRANVIAVPKFFNEDTASEFDFTQYDFVIDAIDCVTDKLLLAQTCFQLGIKQMSCMGAGNKLHANFEVTDIYKTQVCPLARVMRRELKKRGVTALKVLYSKEEPLKLERLDGQKQVASIATVPSIAGLLCANEVIKELIER